MADLDQHLVGIVAGDPDAFGRWVAGAEVRIRLSLSRFSGTVDTEAVVQECLLRVWQVAPRVTLDGKGDSLLRLAVRIARNLAVDEIRRHRTTRDATEHGTLEAIAEVVPPEVSDPLLRELIARCRDKLPAKPRAALDRRMSARGGQSDESLASDLGMKLNTFLQNFTRARKALAQCLRRGGVTLELLGSGGPS